MLESILLIGGVIAVGYAMVKYAKSSDDDLPPGPPTCAVTAG